MRQLIISTIILHLGLISSYGQNGYVDTYCIKLKEPSTDEFFVGVHLDSVPKQWRTPYEGKLKDIGKLLSRFGEEPLTNSDHKYFRSITIDSFDDLKNVQLLKIEKWEDKVEVTVKLIKRLKDSTIMVHKRYCETEIWDKFESVANKYFVSQPSFKDSKNLIHDGSLTVFEGFVSNQYHFLDRHMILSTDPDLLEVNSFLFKAAGDIFDINCRKNTREN